MPIITRIPDAGSNKSVRTIYRPEDGFISNPEKVAETPFAINESYGCRAFAKKPNEDIYYLYRWRHSNSGMYRFDGESFTLITDTILENQQNGCAYVCDNEYLYRVGGGSNTNNKNFCKINLETGEYVELKKLPWSSWGEDGVCMYNGELYVVGCTNGSSSIGKGYKYNKDDDSWTKLGAEDASINRHFSTEGVFQAGRDGQFVCGVGYNGLDLYLYIKDLSNLSEATKKYLLKNVGSMPLVSQSNVAGSPHNNVKDFEGNPCILSQAVYANKGSLVNSSYNHYVFIDIYKLEFYIEIFSEGEGMITGNFFRQYNAQPHGEYGLFAYGIKTGDYYSIAKITLKRKAIKLHLKKGDLLYINDEFIDITKDEEKTIITLLDAFMQIDKKGNVVNGGIFSRFGDEYTIIRKGQKVNEVEYTKHSLLKVEKGIEYRIEN